MSDLLKRIERACSGQFPDDYDKGDLLRLLDEAGDELRRQQPTAHEANKICMTDMKYWRIGRSEFHEPALLLLDDDTDRVIAIRVDESGKIEFRENRDGWFNVAMSPEDAKTALLEAVAWIDANTG